MQLVPYQSCRSADGWCPVPVASDSTDVSYVVLVSPWAPQESICQCQGYVYKGRCKHQERAARQVCRWTEKTDLAQQTPEERSMKICPRCGGETHWEIDVIDED